jgi:hypothetical protein
MANQDSAELVLLRGIFCLLHSFLLQGSQISARGGCDAPGHVVTPFVYSYLMRYIISTEVSTTLAYP